ncbi:MAG: hypothetical protein A2161_19220 [Candidatus Schekmanbacteria bacterium RBG_13_48_7]|uniref:Addiction module toxin RelE n=1 Tax=Candidatus Schekmanbacteria bacterium RBG_13_48_7 TaxID=1817878 RepID=A0A1F7S7N9_9BACT|nr:MAG: hypothetical protein A2161_19220 [Candidatus Schekmanbacteria bacterium RBG_13_48_7]
MHIITRKRLNEFSEKHPDTKSSLEHWYKSMKNTNFESFAEIKRMFSTVDQVGGLTVFNIAGNKARLVTAIHYNRHKVYIRAVLTHHEYDKSKWAQ